MKRKAVIIDLDGTIANTERRAQQAMSVATFKTSAWWDAFFQSEWVKLDRPVGFSQPVVNAYADAHYTIVYLSGRRSNLTKATREWLSRWGYPDGMVILRPRGMPTKEFKRDIVRKLKARGYRIEAAFDDERRNIDTFTEEGIPEVVQIRTNSSKSWKEVLRGLGLPITVDKWLGFRGSRKFPSWQDAVRWMKANPDKRVKRKLKPIIRCVHCGHVSYSKARQCPKCGASVG